MKTRVKMVEVKCAKCVVREVTVARGSSFKLLDRISYLTYCRQRKIGLVGKGCDVQA